MKGFRKPTKSEVIKEQQEVIQSLLKIATEQEKIIADMRCMIERQTKDTSLKPSILNTQNNL